MTALPAHHRFPAAQCTACHAGDPAADTETAAHAGLIVRPGELHNSRQSCGGCHVRQVDWVERSPMSTGTNMVHTTRAIFGSVTYTGQSDQIRDLGTGPADTLLRKLCVSCHLGQPQYGQNADPVHARGGGCLACHLETGRTGTHARLDASVGDRHCFGCHSRSGRISLNYAGLGEVAEDSPGQGHRARYLLGDGRLVERLEDDVHHRAGMGCTDCHTGPGLMGAFTAGEGRGGIDISCDDCHRNDNPRIMLDSLPRDAIGIRRGIPFATEPGQVFLTTKNGTPLLHIDVQARGQPLLYRKRDGQAVRIPQLTDDHANVLQDHETLTCDTCHAAWAPQCFGCHLEFDPNSPQWDHLERRETPGSWHETRWDIRNQAAPIGHRADGRIGLFVPGMIFTIDQPDRPQTRFIRRFAPLHPHTTGASRSCIDCHREPRSLGLGEGQLSVDGDRLRFSPTHPLLDDDLPVDGWSSLDDTAYYAEGTQRPLSPGDITRLYHTPLPSD